MSPWRLIMLALLALLIVRALQPASAQWSGNSMPGGASLDEAPTLSQAMRVRGRVEPGQTVYVKVDPTATGKRLEYAIDGCGPFDVYALMDTGEFVTVVETGTRLSPAALAQPKWLLGRQSWGHGGSIAHITCFMVRGSMDANVGGSYQFTLYRGSEGYSS